MKLLGANVIAAASNDAKLQAAKRAGADHLVNYATQGLSDEVKRLTNYAGADVIYEVVGGSIFDQVSTIGIK